MPKIPAAPIPPPSNKLSQQHSATLKNEKMDWQGGDSKIIDTTTVSKNAAAIISDPRGNSKSENSPSQQAPPPTTINLIQAAGPAIKNEIQGAAAGSDPVEMIYVMADNEEVDDAKIDALIEKFRAQEDPNIDEIQRELKPLLDSQESVRREEKLVNFLKETIAKVQKKQQLQKSSGMQAAQQSQEMPLQAPYGMVGYDGGMIPPPYGGMSAGYHQSQQDMQ